MYSIRTDLAMESHEICKENAKKDDQIRGVDSKVEELDGITLTRVLISDAEGAKQLGKEIGAYVTIESPNIEYDMELYEKTCVVLGDEIKRMVNINDNSVILIVGLGNDRITPDALGPQTVEQIMVTHHLKTNMPQYVGEGIRSVCAIAPGVLGTTGMETVDIVRGVVDKLKPDVVIAVDALASRSVDRMGKTIQIANTGINPGGGVGNRRDGLTEKSLGVKVIAVGVPTVVDAATLAIDSLAKSNGVVSDDVKNAMFKNVGGMVVTPKNIDLVIEKVSKTVANGINMALHTDLTFEEIESYVG